MSLLISCAKEFGGVKLQGVYSPLARKGMFGENTFMNKAERTFLYKIRSDIYVIGRRLGGRSFRAILKSSDIFSKNWHVCRGRNNWVHDVDMVVSRLDEGAIVPEEVSNKDAVVVLSRYSNISGGYRVSDDHLNGCRVYYNDEAGLYIYKIANFWVIGPMRGSRQFYMRSKPTNSTVPFWADWRHCGITVSKFIGCDDEDTSDDGSMYLDEIFKNEQSSIGMDKISNANWVRASKLQPSGSEMVLFHDVEPGDIMQGALGDCWLLCALSALAEFPNYFSDNIFHTDKVSTDGKYDISLYDASKRDWITVTIDDFIPCSEKKWYENSRPLFAQPHENEMYILLLEKAFAKMSGSYGKLSGGYPALGWMALTGCEDLHFWGKNPNGNAWTKRLAATNKIREEPWNFQKMWVKGTSEVNENDKMFEFLAECDQKNYVMSAAIIGKVMEKAREDGLIERHAYTMIQVYHNENIRLVQLRNPWGNNHEWNGDWSDTSSKWKEHPDIALKLEWNNDPDGLFWIDWNHFVNIFHDIQIAAKSMTTPKITKKT